MYELMYIQCMYKQTLGIKVPDKYKAKKVNNVEHYKRKRENKERKREKVLFYSHIMKK